MSILWKCKIQLFFAELFGCVREVGVKQGDPAANALSVASSGVMAKRVGVFSCRVGVAKKECWKEFWRLKSREKEEKVDWLVSVLLLFWFVVVVGELTKAAIWAAKFCMKMDVVWLLLLFVVEGDELLRRDAGFDSDDSESDDEDGFKLRLLGRFSVDQLDDEDNIGVSISDVEMRG